MSYTLTWITEKKLERGMRNYVGIITGTFYSGGEKMRNASGHQSENERERTCKIKQKDSMKTASEKR